MAYIGGIVLIILFTSIAFWRGNPAIFMVTAGISIMAGLASPDALAGLGYSTYGVSIGLMLIAYSFICIALAFGNLYKGKALE
jgi:hypothetical protein